MIQNEAPILGSAKSTLQMICCTNTLIELIPYFISICLILLLILLALKRTRKANFIKKARTS